MPRTLPAALLFDLDDTILSYSANIDETWKHSIHTHGTALGDRGRQRLIDEIAASRDWFWSDPELFRKGRLDLLQTRRNIVAEAMRRVGLPVSNIATIIADTYSERRDELLALFPGAVETLQAVRDHGTKMALLTNGGATMQRLKINRFDLAKYFDCIIVEGEFGAGKPDPSVYRHALKSLDATAEETWMVGDNLLWDVAGPQSIGAKGIWMDVRGEGLPQQSSVKPDRIIRSLPELLLEQH